MSQVPHLESSVEKYVHYPSDDEDHGIVITAWRGPMAKDQFKMTALMVLMEYLTDTAISPLQRDFVELTEPFCSKVGTSERNSNFWFNKWGPTSPP
jgi:Zn-dependent M16 (insulinase) family peptidase